MRVIAAIEDPDVIKKILKSRPKRDGRLSASLGPLPMFTRLWRAPPGDLFPSYDEQPGSAVWIEGDSWSPPSMAGPCS